MSFPVTLTVDRQPVAKFEIDPEKDNVDTLAKKMGAEQALPREGFKHILDACKTQGGIFEVRDVFQRATRDSKSVATLVTQFEAVLRPKGGPAKAVPDLKAALMQGVPEMPMDVVDTIAEYAGLNRTQRMQEHIQQLSDKSYDQTSTGFGKTKELTLSSPTTGSVVGQYLTSGANKDIYRMDNDLVMAVSSSRKGSGDDVVAEVAMMRTLARSGIPVLETSNTFNFEVFDDGDERVSTAFIQESFPQGYVEIPKEYGARLRFLEVQLGENPSQEVLSTATKDLSAIRGYFQQHGPWGDFQIILNPTDGHMIVFDPMAEPLSSQEGQRHQAVVQAWTEFLSSKLRSQNHG